MSEHVSIDRTFDAPRARVWHAWTDPEALAEWWSPEVTFTDVGQQTLVKVSSGPYDREMARMAELGWESQFDKLAACWRADALFAGAECRDRR